jgi:fumarate hydratase class II
VERRSAVAALHIDYGAATKVARQAWASGKTVRAVCRERRVLDENELAEALDPVRITEPEQ